MNSTNQPSPAKSPRWFNRLMRRIAFRGLRRITEGMLDVQDGAAGSTFGDDSSLRATVRVVDPRLYRELLLGGSMAASAAYVRGAWECDDLTNLFRVLVRNQAAAENLDGAWS